MTLRSRLRDATSQYHDRLESARYQKALLDGTIPRICVLTFFRCLAIVHATLERSLSQVDDPRVRSVWNPSFAKLPLLLSDLGKLEGDNKIQSIRPATQASLRLAARVLSDAETPISLLGYLYVLEGSQMGGIALKGLYAKVLGKTPAELGYMGCYGSETRQTWDRFVSQLNAISPVSSDEIERIERSAVALFEGLERVMHALYPFTPEDVMPHITSINPEAGSHALPESPIDVDIALRAGARARQRFPYLSVRFGERGQRFTASDSCWLLTLMPLEHEMLRKNLSWLRTVLASRGLPSLILESHLSELADEFQAVYPSRVHETAGFRSIVSEFKSARESLLPANKLADIRKLYESQPGEAGLDAPAMTALLASALADEALGIENAFTALSGWLSEKDRFSLRWIETMASMERDIRTASGASRA